MTAAGVLRCEAADRCGRQPWRSVVVFDECANTGCGPHGFGFHLGCGWDDCDGPALRIARLAFQYRANVARDRRPARPDCRRPAVELRDAETPDFFLVSRLKREHEVILCSRDYRRLMLAV